MSRFIEVKGHNYTVRGLTRKDIRELREKGINLFALDADQVDEAMDEIFKRTLSDDDFKKADGLTHGEAAPIFNRILIATYGGGDEEKNLSRPGPGIRTRAESNIAESV